MGFAILVLLVPVFCPMMYFFVASSERQASGPRGADPSQASGMAKLALATAVIAGVVSAVGLIITNYGLFLGGIAGVLVGAGTLLWLVQGILERSSSPT